ncbi:hypothetical protein GCM10025771_24430 [Niveibacterium umoris]|uniref:DUF4136 domain-containing protein n=1 Tax=Niveibacterium umoris TaxID=1193620 RepID=A0A840BLD2_9RHOO|nr:hypothetical protein [Niveibacterium umoris]MBB4012368.1 hypothetical protein [Niveibacterium umoris]
MLAFAAGLSRRATVLAGLASALAGCASTQISSQWSDPALAGAPLRGNTVMVVCQAAELSTQRICQDQLAAQLRAMGATPVAGQPAADNGDRNAAAKAQLPAARAAGAKALWFATVAPDAAYVSPGPQISFGIGGFSMGGGGSHSGGGVGVSMPVGGGRVDTAYGAENTVFDAADGRVLWSAKAVAPPSDRVDAQLADLAKVAAEAARKAGLF